jgi:hypothetical protein
MSGPQVAETMTLHSPKMGGYTTHGNVTAWLAEQKQWISKRRKGSLGANMADVGDTSTMSAGVPRSLLRCVPDEDYDLCLESAPGHRLPASAHFCQEASVPRPGCT